MKFLLLDFLFPFFCMQFLLDFWFLGIPLFGFNSGFVLVDIYCFSHLHFTLVWIFFFSFFGYAIFIGFLVFWDSSIWFQFWVCFGLIYSVIVVFIYIGFPFFKNYYNIWVFLYDSLWNVMLGLPLFWIPWEFFLKVGVG